MEQTVMSKLGYGGITMVVGMLIVFLGLTILICFVSMMGSVFKSIDKKKAEKAKAEKEAAAAAAASVPEAIEEAEEEEVNDPELIAVIAAAIAAFDSNNKNLVVRKVRRVPAGWKSAARQEQLYRL